MATCNCIGPQNGQPLCPCQMRAVQGWRGAEEWRPYATAALPTQQPARKRLQAAPETIQAGADALFNIARAHGYRLNDVEAREGARAVLRAATRIAD